MPRLIPSLLVLAGLCTSSAFAQVTWRTDSLMTTWAVKQRMATVGSTVGQGVVRAVDTENLYADLKREAPGIPVFADSNVVTYTDLYGEPLREHFRVLLGVSSMYLPMIEKELSLQGLPQELKYLPMALSAMNQQPSSLSCSAISATVPSAAGTVHGRQRTGVIGPMTGGFAACPLITGISGSCQGVASAG